MFGDFLMDIDFVLLHIKPEKLIRFVTSVPKYH